MLRTYDPKQVSVIFNGNPLSGFTDGTFIEIEFDEDLWNKVTGADGETSRSKVNNYAGAITVTLKQTSAGNDIMNTMMQRDRRNNTGRGPIIVKDASGRTVWSARNAWIRAMPSQAFSLEAEDREWIIDTDALSGSIGGNDA